MMAKTAPPEQPAARYQVKGGDGWRSTVEQEALTKLALPWRISSFELNAGGSQRVIMGSDGFGIAWIMGRSEAEHDAIANAIIAALQTPRPQADMVEMREKIARVIGDAILGTDLEPFINPESWDFYDRLTEQILAILTSGMISAEAEQRLSGEPSGIACVDHAAGSRSTDGSATDA
jgi:citrate lyase alpha subunit